MAIYMKIDGVKGNVTDHDHKEYAGTANGGVWKTTNFVTREAAAPAARPKINVFICPSDPSVVQISRMSLAGGSNTVDGRDASAKLKVEQLVRAAGPNGKLYVATDAGVYQNASRFDGQGRLIVGTEGGIWRSGRGVCSNNLKQLGLGFHNSATVEIIVTDHSGSVISTQLLRNATLSRHSGGILVALGDGSVR